ncbi:MAG TPA: hypothetical protein VJ767_07575 [Nitrososphaeraceae archaeon]|nr:hypothetical protein [Nitrososphaeraceae archaeon]
MTAYNKGYVQIIFERRIQSDSGSIKSTNLLDIADRCYLPNSAQKTILLADRVTVQ